MPSLHDFQATTIRGEVKALRDFKGCVVLVVNTASKCGFTPQYKGLQALHDRFADDGFEVLGFPCDQFGHQEPDDDETISTFCVKYYGVTFPLFSKIEVNGPKAHPLFEFLRRSKRGFLGDRIKWNFTKFLVGRDGQVIARFGPRTKPERLVNRIQMALQSTAP